jgi:kinesin family protein C1
VGKYKSHLEDKGWEYAMEVSFIEIYNETVLDLLRDGANNNIKHEIKRDENGQTYISEIALLQIDPNKKEEIEEVMELAARYRSVSATNMNEQSSRSHAVFTLYLHATQKDQQVSLNGSLSLVDLAGSERLEKSGATGSQAKEAIQINKSLSALADVFTAIGNKQSFVPFRNSKLTYLLQPALSVDGKTLMVCPNYLIYILYSI